MGGERAWGFLASSRGDQGVVRVSEGSPIGQAGKPAQFYALISHRANVFIVHADRREPCGGRGEVVLGLDETNLVEAAQKGSLDSFGELCGLYYRPMAAIAYSVLGDHQLAEDAAQEAFARALGGLYRLRRPERFGAWLARICRNVAVRMARARRRDGTAGDVWNLPARPEEDDVGLAVRRCLGRLKARDREVIVLRYYDNLSHDQIAAVLRLSPAAVHGRLQRARRRMAGVMRREGLLEPGS